MIEIQTGKLVIDTEIKALIKLRDSLSDEFEKSISIIKKTKGKIVVSGIGKSGHIAKKNIVNTFLNWLFIFFYSSFRS